MRAGEIVGWWWVGGLECVDDHGGDFVAFVAGAVEGFAGELWGDSQDRVFDTFARTDGSIVGLDAADLGEQEAERVDGGQGIGEIFARDVRA